MADIKWFRKVNKLTQTELADYLGTGKSFISLIETGRSKLPLNMLHLLLENDKGWDTSMFSPHMESKNWIVSEDTYASKFHDTEALQRIGIRIDEIFNLKRNIKCIDYESFANKIGFDYVELVSIIGGLKPAPDKLLRKILDAYPDINPCWLYTGVGKP